MCFAGSLNCVHEAIKRVPLHWVLLHHPMPFVFFVLLCEVWEICLMLCYLSAGMAIKDRQKVWDK